MANARVYEEKAVIHELTQGKETAKQLKVNLHSPEAREVLINKILSSYNKALYALKARDSAGQPSAPALPASSGEFGLDQLFTIQHGNKVINKKRKMPTTWDAQTRICSDNGLVGKNCDHGAQLAAPPPPRSPEKHEIIPTNHQQQLSPLHPGELLASLKANLSVNTSDLGGDTALFSNTFALASPGLMEDFHRFQFPNQYYDELLQVYSPPLMISPELEISPSMDFAAIW